MIEIEVELDSDVLAADAVSNVVCVSWLFTIPHKQKVFE